MTVYLIRRILYAIPVLIGVNILTFFLFFIVNSPDDMARAHLGEKHVTQHAIENWKIQHGYQLPLFWNADSPSVSKLTDTLFFTKSLRLFMFDFGQADSGRDISHDILQRMWPSLMIAIPVLIFGVLLNIVFALLMVFFRGTVVEHSAVLLCIMLMSVSSLFYIIGGQYLIAKLWHWVPISGFNSDFDAYRFILLPVLVAIIGGLGAGSRWYRTIFLEELHKDYVRTARAKGASNLRVLFSHVLKNGLIPILTGVVVIIPSLFMGSLILESFFGIPGLGSYTIDAISKQDFSIVRSMVFLGSVLYIVGLILTDISYTLVDPRVRFS